MGIESIYQYMDKIWVVCPQCNNKAISTSHKLICEKCGLNKPRPAHMIHHRFSFKCNCGVSLYGALSLKDKIDKVLACSNCGQIFSIRCKQCGYDLWLKIKPHYTNVLKFISIPCSLCHYKNRKKVVWSIAFGAKPADPYVGQLLWLQAYCFNKIFWAYNNAHLASLKEYVASLLRDKLDKQSSFTWRLPAWIKQAKHRVRLLKIIDQLENK